MFVTDELQDKTMIDEAYLLKNVRELRNACAHNNYRILNEIANIGISKETRNKRMSNSRIQQIVTLLYLNKKITRIDGVLKHQTEKLQDLKSRIEHDIDYCSKNNLIQANFNLFN